MKYLLDINALVAWAHMNSAAHATFHRWAQSHGFKTLATCAHAELGFIRVSMQGFGHTREMAETTLAAMKRHMGGFVAAAPSPRLPAWTKTAAQTSDAYLAQLATSAGLILATFDLRIPDPVERIG